MVRVKAIISLMLCLPGLMKITAQEQAIETVIQTGHYASVRSVALSPDGKLAATGSADKTIKLWEVATGREIRSCLGSVGTVHQLAFGPEGKQLASIDAEYKLKLWEVETSREMCTIKLADDEILSVIFSPDGKSLVTGTEKNHVIIWDIETGNEIRRIKPDTADIPMQKSFGYPTAQTVDISNDGKLLLTGSNDRTAFLFDFRSGKQLKKFKGDRTSCTSCMISASFNPDAGQIVIGRMDSVFIWDVESEKVIRKMEGRRGSWDEAYFSHDGKYVASTIFGETYIWNAQNGKQITQLSGHLSDIRSICFNPVSNLILTGSDDRTAKLWRVPGGKESLTFRGYLNDFDEAILSDNYMYWVAFINEIKVSPDGKSVAIGNTGNNAKLMDFETGKVIRTFRGHESIVISIDFSPDGKYLATGGADGTAKIWDTETGEMIRSFPEKTSNIPYFSIDFSPDGNYLATGSWDGRVRVWDIKNGTILASINAHENVSPYTVQFSHNGLYVISGGLDRKLKLFEIDTGLEIKEFIGHTDVVSAVRRHPDGIHILSGSWDGKAKLWDLASGMQVKRFLAHDARIQAVDFGPEGKYMVTGSDDNTAKLWDVEEGTLIRTFTGHRGTVSSVNISPDGKFLITGSHDGTIKTWDLETGDELLTQIFIGEDDWLVKTKEGYFDASEGAKKSIFFVKGIQIYNIDQFFDEFYRPGLLNEVYRTRGQISQDANLLDRLKESPPPTVKLIIPDGLDTVKTGTLNLSARITNNGGGINEVRLLNNGKGLVVDNEDVRNVTREGRSITKIMDVPLVPGDNIITFSAYSNGRIESSPDTFKVYYTGPERVINCYLVSIGINEYRNPALDLNYAKADAKAFSKIIDEKGKRLFKQIELVELYDGQATRENILETLDKLAETVRPEDVFLFYYAGHGSMMENKFFFIPTESVSLYQLDRLNEESLYAGLIQEKFKNIPALKQIVIMDACQSGGSTEILAQRGAMEEKALAQLSRSSGVHVLAAAGSEQFATELDNLGHGLFTYVILEALNGGADGAPKDGNVTIYELKAYLNDQVPELSKKYKGSTQWPYTFSIGHDFPVVRNE
jgi:WD40 repeat protein